MLHRSCRTNPLALSCRAVEDGQSGAVLIGMASLYYDAARPDETEYRLKADLVERIPRGVFDEHIENQSEILGLQDHDEMKFLGKRSAGTLRVDLTAAGLAYEIDLPDTAPGRDALELLKRGDLSGSSFSMIRAKAILSAEDRDGRTLYVRTITRFDGVYDLGPTVCPAYSGTTANLIGRRSCGISRVARSTGDPAELESIETELADFIKRNWDQAEADYRIRQMENELLTRGTI